MNINATLIAQMLAFFVLVMFTMKVIWPPVVKALDERAKKIGDGLAAAEQGHQKLADASKLADAEIHKARLQAADILTSTDRTRQEMIEQAKLEASEEVRMMIEKAKANIELETSRAKDALRDHLSSLVVSGAERILRREIDVKAHSDLLLALQQEL